MLNSKNFKHIVESNIEAVNRSVASDGYAVSDEVFVGGFGTQVIVARTNYDCTIRYIDRNPFKVAGWLYANNLLIAKDVRCDRCVRCYDAVELEDMLDSYDRVFKVCPICGDDGHLIVVDEYLRGEYIKALAERHGIVEDNIE